jgi:hypothetical protein
VTHVPPSAPPPTTSPGSTPSSEDPLTVRREPEAVTVAAWAEPRHLPPGGGQVHILVRVRRPGGRPAVGVEVRLGTSKGRLYSRGRVLRTDSQGRTRDRLTTRRTAVVTLNAGGTRYSFVVPVMPKQAAPGEEMTASPAPPTRRGDERGGRG